MKSIVLLCLLPLALIAQSSQREDTANLKGINFLYMNVDTSLAPDITASERMDISDIVELQLRRADINLRPYVVNAPKSNVPLVEVSIKEADARGGDSYELVLRVHDFVTIDRNKEKTIATIFEVRRQTTPTTNNMVPLKTRLRELMGDFVAAFKKENP